MTKAEKITKLLDYGLNVVVRDGEGNYQSFIPYEDQNGDYRCSSWLNSIKEAKQYAGVCVGYPQEDFEEYSKDWEIVECYKQSYKQFKKGDKVKILDSIKETNDWDKDYYSDMVGIIKEVYNEMSGLYYKVYPRDEFHSWNIGAEYLAPYLEEEDRKITIKISKKSLDALKESGIEIIE